MPGKNIHTTYSKTLRNWRNVSEGAKRPARVYTTKELAQAAGRESAKNRHVEHFIHNENGKISARNSYGHDPEKSKG